MNLKLIDGAISLYGPQLDAATLEQLQLFRSLWQEEAVCAAQAVLNVRGLPDKSHLQTMLEEGVPFMSASPIRVDGKQLAQAIERLCGVLIAREDFEMPVKMALQQVDWHEVVVGSPLALAGSAPYQYLEALAEALSERCASQAALPIMLVVCSIALRSQLEGAAAEMMGAVKFGEGFRSPCVCPACGSQAGVAVVSGNLTTGRAKTLWCPVCSTTWEFDRIRCPRCGTTNQGKLHYTSIRGDEGHRLAYCDDCGGYIRTTYKEDVLVPVSYEVEDVVMARLDALAASPAFAEHLEKERAKRK